ncbi:CAHM6 protein, partial [Ptilorrhoa leucosticta]|nr:CAHM6 protein [Ptilorrhoa leucosticta]
MDRLREALDFCIRHQTILGYSVVSLLTAASEHIFSSVVFKCPCNSGNVVYGSFFLLVPAFILLLLGYMVNARLWHRLTGRCSKKKECSPSETCTHFCQVFLPATVRSLVASLTWIAVALLGANFYECAASGSSLIERLFCKDKGPDCQEKLLKIPCDEKLSAQISSENLSLQAQSQLIGWSLIAIIMTVALISKCASRCCSPLSYLQLKFRKIYSKEEQEVFETKAKEHANKLAERNTNCFFEATDPAPFPIPSKEEWRKISLFCTFDSQERYYDMMFKSTGTNSVNSAESEEGGQELTLLTSVDEAQAGKSEL